MPRKFTRQGDTRPAAAPAAAHLRNAVRVIAGQWRGRRISFPTLEGLRPSPDRVRETLFNWLQSDIAGSRCLDLFAGSGVLGIEALSRGAALSVFVDREPQVIAQLRKNLEVLGAAKDARVIQADALQWLSGPSLLDAPAFDIVFLDPPFASELLMPACRMLAERGWLAPGALIYLELPARNELVGLPSGWEALKAKRAGEVGYHLLRSPP